MSYTNTELIRHHLVSAFPLAEQVNNQSLYLKGDDYVTFFNGAVDSSLLKVKSPKSNHLARAVVVLTNNPVNLSSTPIVPGSVAVASDSSMGILYTENVDYAIDYNLGTVGIKTGGALSDGTSVTVWYQPFALYTEGSDYRVKADAGQMRRLSSGSIADGETVYLDYTPLYDSFNDTILENAVAEANSLVEQQVDANGQFGADRTLQAAATKYALAIVCRTSAARELSSRRGEDRTATAWLKLSEQYETAGERLLKQFRPSAKSAASPACG